MQKILSQDKEGLRNITIDVEYESIWQRLGRNVSIGIAGSGISVAIRLGQTLLLTRFLRIDDYGRLLIVLNLFLFLNSFFGLSVGDAIFRFFQPLKEQGDERALKNLLLSCLTICFVSGLLIYLGVVIASPWLATHLYSSPGIASLFKIYGLTVLVSAFSGIYESVLRMHDRFSAVVVPLVCGNLLTLIILLAYFTTRNTGAYDLRVIVMAFAAGIFVQSIPPLVKALRLLSPLLFHAPVATTQWRTKHRPDLVRCLFNSNLSGYLRFAINPGDIFLLGLFSSPFQVALYGLAKQLTAPLGLLQNTIQTAVTPEVTALVARLKLQTLQRLIKQYVGSAVLIGGFVLLCALLLGRLIIPRFFGSEYAQALPVYYCLAIAAWLFLVLLVFRPVATALDLLTWHNLALALSAAVLVALIIAGRLSALTMAYVQLLEASILRFSFSLLVWKKLARRRYVDENSSHVTSAERGNGIADAHP